MNPQGKSSRKTSQEIPLRKHLTSDGTKDKNHEQRQAVAEAELWEPPFERWIRMADDLLRGWPGTSTDKQSHAA